MNSSTKIKDIGRGTGESAFSAWRRLQYGEAGLGHVFWSELLVLLVSRWPGAGGLALRAALFPGLFKTCPRGVVFGRDLTLRHSRKISIGRGTILDDGVTLDAKGDTNRGIEIGEDVYIGRNSILYCKNGDITLGDRVNIASNCQIFSCNSLTVEADTLIGAYSYLLSGGEYDPTDPTPFSGQSGMRSRGPLRIGPDGWLGARVTVLDGASIGERCVIGAGAVVTRPQEARSVVVGVPARRIRRLEPPAR